MKAKHIINALFLVFLVVGSYFILTNHNRGKRLWVSDGPVFGTAYHIEYEYTERLDSLILGELKKVDASLSMFNSNSTVSRINRGETQEADEMLQEVFALSQKVSEETDGAFDVTVAPLVNAWGFGTDRRQDISAGQVDSLKAFVGYEKVKLQAGKLVKSDDRVMLDFSSIAKGYGVDRVARLFDSLDIDDYMIEIGGEVVVKGKHPEGRPWKIGVNKPSDKAADGIGEIQTVLDLTDMAMATSGNYRRFYERDGKRFAHTIDPKSGYPVRHTLLSATVLAADCATADAYATAFMVMGAEKAKAVLKRHPELAAYFICSDNVGGYTVWYSQNMARYLQP